MPAIDTNRTGHPAINQMLWIVIAGLYLLTACGGGTVSEDNVGNPAPLEDPGTDEVRLAYAWDPADFDHLYEVGPGREYADPNHVPWESLEPSTLVRIYRRDLAYRAKWVINVAASADAPVVVLGVSDNGRRPR